jgi:hypothetical protein
MKISEKIHETGFGILMGLKLEKRKFGSNCFEKSFKVLNFVGINSENDKESKRFEESISRYNDSFSCDSFFWVK